MSRRNEFLYYEEPWLQMVRLPYGNRRLAMEIVLPAPGLSLQALVGERVQERPPEKPKRSLIRMLDRGNVPQDSAAPPSIAYRWIEWTSHMSNREGLVEVPHFTLDHDCTLSPCLIALGMDPAFDKRRADFSAMLDLVNQRAYISEVLHRTHLDVNEEGTTAAAAMRNFS